jgi:hypothetical protein
MTQPVWKVRAGGNISCALWQNEVTVNGRTVTMLKATVERRYKNKNGDWQSTGSFSRNEVSLVQYVLSKAFEKMVGEQEEDVVQEEEVR